MLIDNLVFYPVYLTTHLKRNKPGITETGKGRKGVYFIKENGILIYIGLGTYNVKNTLYRHFQVWTDKRCYYVAEYILPFNRVTYFDKLHVNKYEVAIHFTDTAKEASDIEKKMVIKYDTRDNRRKYLAYKLDENDNLTYVGYNTEKSFFTETDENIF